MTRKSLTLAGFILALATPALAQADLEDTDGDGVYSIEELQAAYPEMTAEDFGRADVDQSGDVSAEELTVAIETGLLVK